MPHIRPTYPISEVLSTSDFTQQILPEGCRGTDEYRSSSVVSKVDLYEDMLTSLTKERG